MEMKTSHRFPLLMDRSLPVLRPSAGGGGLGYSSVQLVQITEESMRKMKRMKGTWRRNVRHKRDRDREEEHVCNAYRENIYEETSALALVITQSQRSETEG